MGGPLSIHFFRQVLLFVSLLFTVFNMREKMGSVGENTSWKVLEDVHEARLIIEVLMGVASRRFRSSHVRMAQVNKLSYNL